MSDIFIKRGSEGPRHDPYSYTEITVKRTDGNKVLRSATIHAGLAYWAETSDGRREDQDTVRVNDLFTEVAGITPHQAHKAHRELEDRRYRYHPCGQKYFHDCSGYPGESFVVCGKCGKVVDSHFDRSAVE